MPVRRDVEYSLTVWKGGRRRHWNCALFKDYGAAACSGTVAVGESFSCFHFLAAAKQTVLSTAAILLGDSLHK